MPKILGVSALAVSCMEALEVFSGIFDNVEIESM